MNASLTDILNDPTAVAGLNGDRRCKLGKELDRLEAGDRAAVLTALHGTAWTDARLSQALETAGHRSSPSSLSNHRTRTCICNTYGEDETR